MNSWHKMSWAEIGELIQAGMDTAILPVGATEQHGPHMGCGMDAEIAGQLCQVVAEKTGAIVLPTLSYGCSIGHSQRWPGTVALQPKTMIDVVKDMGDWIYNSGFRRLFIVNGHVGNNAPLRCALEMLRAEHDDMMIALINSGAISQRVKDKHFHDAQDWHANDAETSLMLALQPAMVREELLQNSDDPDRTDECVFAHPVNRTSKNGVTGKPSLASTAKGNELFNWMVEDLADLVKKGMNEQAPLTFSYFEKFQMT
jgi:creatinine amidohydrolase